MNQPVKEDEASAIAAQFGAQLKEPGNPFTLLVRFRVKEGMQNSCEAAFAEARIPTLKEKGALAFDMNREIRDSTRFVVYERWKSLADFETHHRTDYITKLRRDLYAMLAEPPEFHVLLPAAQ